MAYFLETNEIAAFVAPNLVPYILEGKSINKDEVFIVKFLFLGDEYKIIADKQFVADHAIANSEVFDLESTGKEAVFFDLKPVPESLYLKFLKMNNIQL